MAAPEVVGQPAAGPVLIDDVSGTGRPEPVPSRHGGSGGEFAAAFHREVVGPLLRRELPRLRYAAARLGSGSDVLGYDDARSQDHDWGCRLTLLVDEADRAIVPTVDGLLARSLPDRFRDLPVRFATTWQPAESHEVHTATVGDFAASRLGVDPLHGMSALDWLALTGQGVLEVTAGPVFHDATSGLRALHRELAWYPPDVERYVLASSWERITERMPLVGRTAHTGQALQSLLLCTMLVEDLVSLAFLLHRRWSPYDKWRERAFTGLPRASDLRPALVAAATAQTWEEREAALVTAIHLLLAIQRDRSLPVPTPGVVPFWNRPYRTVSDEVSALLLTGITDPVLIRLPVVGSVEQWVDNPVVLAHPHRRAALTAAYRAWLAGAGRPRVHDGREAR